MVIHIGIFTVGKATTVCVWNLIADVVSQELHVMYRRQIFITN